jgi:hypothetical protein
LPPPFISVARFVAGALAARRRLLKALCLAAGPVGGHQEVAASDTETSESEEDESEVA